MKIAVLLGSIRGIRRGGRVAKWLMPELKKYQDASFELLDLKDWNLPFYNEDDSPEGLEGKYTNEIGKKWAEKIGEFDAFLIITPEYNHGTSAVLKNALDWVYYEWNRKPIGFVSYAPGAAAGIRAVEQLRLNAIELQMAPIEESLHIANVLETIDENGKLLQGRYSEKLATLMTDLLWWATALKSARDASALRLNP